MLCDRIVCGINNSSIQKKLLFETDLTFEQTFAIAEGSAEADKNVKELETPRTHTYYPCHCETGTCEQGLAKV